jgi:hypothetical protein
VLKLRIPGMPKILLSVSPVTRTARKMHDGQNENSIGIIFVNDGIGKIMQKIPPDLLINQRRPGVRPVLDAG